MPELSTFGSNPTANRARLDAISTGNVPGSRQRSTMNDGIRDWILLTVKTLSICVAVGVVIVHMG